jgi:hypothetical protein
VLIAPLIACWQVDMQLAAQLSPRTRSKVATIFSQHEILEPLLPPLDLPPSVTEGGGGKAEGGDEGGGTGTEVEIENEIEIEPPPLSGMLSTNELRLAIEELGYEIAR